MGYTKLPEPEILKKFDFVSVCSTPIETQKPLVKDKEASDADVHLYRSMIGSLMYLTASRPDIMYLKGKPKLCLWYPRVSSFNLEAYSNSDYAGANLDRKSTTGEFKNRDFIEFCGSKGIKREYSNARTPQQNGVAERKNRTLIEAARTMLADSFLPNTFWAEAVSTACYVLNRVLVTKPHNKTPYELVTGKIPIISYIRPFGCHVTILNTIDHLGKFDGKSDEGFLVGYSLQSKAFRVYNLETKRVEENLHITFLENKPNVAGKGPTWLFDLDYLTDSMNYQPMRSENQANKHAGPQEANHNAGTQDNIDVGDSEKEDESAQDYFVLPIWSSYSSTVKRSTTKDAGEAPNKHLDLKTDEKPVDKEDQVFLDELERLKRQEKDANDAAEALRKEFAQETENLLLQAGAAKASSTNTVNTVSSTNTVNTVSTPVSTASPYDGLSFSDPTNPDQDDSEIPALEDIYKNPTDGIFTNSSYDDEGAVADFTNLETVVNVSPIPTSRINSIHPSTLILGDPQSAVQTRSKVSKSSGAHAFVSYIQKQRRNNHKDFQHCLFACFLSQNEPKKISEALEDESSVDAMQKELLQFKIQKVYRNKKDERGVVVRNKARLVAQGHRQEEWIDYDEVFAPVARIEAIRIFLAFASYMGFIVYQIDVKSAFLYGKIDEKNGYRRGTIDMTLFIKKDKYDIILVQVYVDDIIFGSTKISWCDEFEALMKSRFQMSSMRELTFFLGLQVKQKEDDIFICACSRFQVTPKTSHLSAVKRIFRYLKGKPRLGLWYPRVSSFDLEAYSDSDYARTNLDRRSTTGVYHSKTKHIAIRHHFIRDAYEKKLIQVLKIHTDDNVADLLTKAFDVSRQFNHTEDEGATSERPSKAQPTPSPPHPSEVNVEPQSDPSPRPSPTPHIPDSILEVSGGSHGGQSSSDKSLSGNEGGMTLQSVYDLYISLCTKVTDQAKEINHLKAQIKKLMKQVKLVITHHRAWMKSVSLKQRLVGKTTLKANWMQKESVSKQGRKSAKAEPLVHKDPLFDELDDDEIHNMDTEDAQDVGRTRNGENEEKEGTKDAFSTEDVVSTDKEKVSTDRSKVSTDRSKDSTDKDEEGIDRDKDSNVSLDDGTDDRTEARTKAVSREKEKGVELKDVEEIERPRPTSTRSLLTLKPLLKIDPKDKGKKKIKEEDKSDTKSKDIPEAEKKFKQLARDEEMARKLQEDWETKEERKRIAKEEATKTALSEEYDFIEARIEADRLLALKLQNEEREQFSVEERAKFLHDTIAAQRRFLAEQRAIAIRNKPPTRTQLRNQMMTYLKHVANKKHSDLKSKTFKEIQALYEKVKRFDESFTSVGSTEDERRIKEMNKGVKDTNQKRLKEEDTKQVPAKVEVTEQGTLDSEIMEKKSGIARLDKVSSPDGDYLVLYKANGNFKAFNYLMEVLHIFDRQDLFHLYELMMEQYSKITLEGFELILWGDLKIMMESLTEENDQSTLDSEIMEKKSVIARLDKISSPDGDYLVLYRANGNFRAFKYLMESNRQDWKIITWRLYEACRVCILELEDGIVIHMLVERRYHLSKELLQRMLRLGLEVKRESTAALNLIRFIKKQIDEE
ncbi:putative ribonuclease H-like domain-containing protein [Tanacetum coccineum]